MTYTFRFRFVLADEYSLKGDQASYIVAVDPMGQEVTLCTPDLQTPVEKSKKLVLRSSGWADQNSALEKGEQYSSAFRRALAKLRIGANFGEFTRTFVITDHGLSYFSEKMGRRVLHDRPGLTVYESDPTPAFMAPNVSIDIGKPIDRLDEYFHSALKLDKKFTEIEKISFDLYNSSFFSHSEIVRFVLLIMSVEAISKENKLETSVIDHVNHIISITTNNNNISEKRKNIIIGNISRLKKESISEGCRRLIEKEIGELKYENTASSKFFTRCYNLRSKIVHGKSSEQNTEKVRKYVSSLENLVSDLLTHLH